MLMGWIVEFGLYVDRCIQWLWLALNTNFVTALSGAFAGAFGASVIANRNMRRRQLLEEILSTKTAIDLSFSIANCFLVQKEQAVRKLCEEYQIQRQAYFELMRDNGQGKSPIQNETVFLMDLQVMSPVKVPIDKLEELITRQISVFGFPVVAVTALSQSIDLWNQRQELRNEFIREFRKKQYSEKERCEHFFGASDERGDRNDDYPSFMKGISVYTDECIFFSMYLCDQLVSHGENLSKLYGSKSPRMTQPNFEKAENAGLLPDKDQYQTWLSLEDE